jgi:ADP-ribosylglycohydrolase
VGCLQVTHFDTRCLASCVAATTAIAMMLQGHDVESEEGLQQLIDQAIAHGLKVSFTAFFKKQFNTKIFILLNNNNYIY